MKKNKLITMLAIAATALTLSSCGEEDNPLPAPEIYITATDDTAGQAIANTKLTTGSTLQLMAAVTNQQPENVEITWESSDSQVVTVSPDGLVTAIGKGIATVTVSANYYLPPLTATLTIEVVDGLIDVDDTPVDQSEAEARRRW